jgi:hypothetical protein
MAAADPEVLAAMTDGANDTTAVAIPGDDSIGGFTGEAQTGVSLAPYLQINSGRSTKPMAGKAGDFVLDNDHLLVPLGQPLRMIILNANVYWKEYIDAANWSPEVRAKQFKTAAEVHASGGTTEWINNVAPSFKRAIAMKVLIQKPKDIMCMYFVIKLGGQEWAPAKWMLDKSAYERKNGREGFGHDLSKACTFALAARKELPENKRLLAGLWDVTVGSVKVGTHSGIIVPFLKLAGQNDAAFIKELEDVVGA